METEEIFYGIWIPGSGWLKNEEKPLAFEDDLIAESVAERLVGAKVEFIDNSLFELEKLFLEQEQKISSSLKWVCKSCHKTILELLGKDIELKGITNIFRESCHICIENEAEFMIYLSLNDEQVEKIKVKTLEKPKRITKRIKNFLSGEGEE